MAHHHHHHHHSENLSGRNLAIAFWLNLGFTIFEFIGGYWVNSVAILSDAVHDLGDSLALGFAWYMNRLGNQKADARFSYGYKRFTLLGALINALILILGTGYVLFETIPRLFAPEMPNAQGMMIFAVIGVLVNGAAVLRMRKGSTLNEKVVTWHLMEDVLGWLAVLIVSIVLTFREWPVLDPILSLIIALFILYNVGKNLKTTLNLLLQGVPGGIDIRQIEMEIAGLKPVQAIHQIHVWSLDGEKNILSLHVNIPENTTREEAIRLKTEIRELLIQHQIHHSTIELDYFPADCSMPV